MSASRRVQVPESEIGRTAGPNDWMVFEVVAFDDDPEGISGHRVYVKMYGAWPGEEPRIEVELWCPKGGLADEVEVPGSDLYRTWALRNGDQTFSVEIVR
jgi:hypothetical protein